MKVKFPQPNLLGAGLTCLGKRGPVLVWGRIKSGDESKFIGA